MCVSINQSVNYSTSQLLAKQLLQFMQSNQPINQSTSVNQCTVNQAEQWTLISVSTIWGRWYRRNWQEHFRMKREGVRGREGEEGGGGADKHGKQRSRGTSELTFFVLIFISKTVYVCTRKRESTNFIHFLVWSFNRHLLSVQAEVINAKQLTHRLGLPISSPAPFWPWLQEKFPRHES